MPLPLPLSCLLLREMKLFQAKLAVSVATLRISAPQTVLPMLSPLSDQAQMR